MPRTQVELPDDLYERAKRYSDQHALPLDETLRRALELLLERDGPVRPPDQEWNLPVVDVGEILTPIDKLRDLLFEEEANRGLPRE